MRSNRPILLVEDDQIDVMTVQRALRQLKVSNRLDIAGNGEEALAHLGHTDTVLPCIILLDLNMPRMGGLEFLQHKRLNAKIAHTPVVVLTSSREEQDRVETFNYNVAGYIVKPVEYTQFVEVVRTIDLYWTLSESPFEDTDV